MKRLLIILVLLLAMTSCTNKIIENPKASTTLEMQEQPKDTMLVVMEQEDSRITHIEIYNMNNQIVYKKKQLDEFYVIAFIIIGCMIGLLFTAIIFNINN
jgi:hypothetical protein